MTASNEQSEVVENVSPSSLSEAGHASVEALRQILTSEQHREVAYDEAVDIGQSLLAFFEVLAEAV